MTEVAAALPPVPPAWSGSRAGASEQVGSELERFVAAERSRCEVFPPAGRVFRALELTPPEAVRVVILGQDPYHGPGQAHGLAFSVPHGVRPPPSLRNVFRELRDDLGVETPVHGCLEAWARQGVLLLNTVLTVRAGEAGSHRGKGWEDFTDGIIERVAAYERPVVFALWGNPARAKAALVPTPPHTVLEAAHPSPLSAHRGFLGTRPFSRINAALIGAGRRPVDWSLAP